jgi:hypothetical protein
MTGPTIAEMAIRLDAFAMVLAKAETQMAWHNLEPHQRNCWRELARCILVESEEYIRGIGKKKED